MIPILAGLMIIALGLFSFGGGYYQWPFFMNNSRARFVATILSRTGARIFYMAVGLLIVGLGVAAMFADPPAP
jgi:Immunity protein 17